MEEQVEFNHCADVLGALAAPERLKIIWLLRGGPHNVGEIADALDIPLVNISHHLMVLRTAGLIRNERQGRFIRYSLHPNLLEVDSKEPGIEHLNLGCCRLEIPKPND